MDTPTNPPPPPPTADPEETHEDHQRRQLWRLYDLLLASLVEAVGRPDVRASTLDVARQFLRDNDIRAYGRRSVRGGLDALGNLRSLALPFDS